MGDVLRPFTVPPAPPPFSSDKSSTPMLYYGLVMVGTAAIVLAIYNLIAIKRCSRRHSHLQSQGAGPNGFVGVFTDLENSRRNLLSSFKYKKAAAAAGGGEGEEEHQGGDDYECPVCLSGFEEGEEVRKLPRCKHCFHALCIDMWLYSHFDCPICRTPVGSFSHRLPAENSRGGLLDAGGGVPV